MARAANWRRHWRSGSGFMGLGMCEEMNHEGMIMRSVNSGEVVIPCSDRVDDDFVKISTHPINRCRK
jgi:hypothetical protein